MIIKQIAFFISLNLLFQFNCYSQIVPSIKKNEGFAPIKFKMNNSEDQYIRFITWLQVWGSMNDNNPGTIGYDFKEDKTSKAIAIRRARMLLYAQLNSKWLLLFHFGINNHNFNSGGLNGNDGKKPSLFIHDAWAEYSIIPKKLSIGSGLHYWNGVSRFASASTTSFMTLDAPIFNWATIETTDQFARQFGIYAKGQLNRFDYRIALNQPFQYGVNPYLQKTTTTNGYNNEPAAKNAFSNNFAFAGYFKWMQKEKESNLLPFETGTYLGEKKILNLGFGFYHHPKSMYVVENEGENQIVKINHATVLGADVFYDAPIGKKGFSFNSYTLVQHMNFGQNYLRNIGILNSCTHVGNADQLGNTYANRSVMGAGNIQPTIGTGTIAYTQAGIKFPEFKNGTSVMPYITLTHKKLEAIGKGSIQYDLGANYFIHKHNAKITAQYSTRPIYQFDNENVKGISQNGLKGQFIVQSQICF